MKMIYELVVFNSCVELKSFSKAAVALGVTAPAVGKVIHKLEQYYGVQLFQRNTRVIVLTEYGEILYKQAAQAIVAMQAVEDQYQTLTQQVTGRLKISMPNVDGIFSHALVEFTRQHPKIKLDVTFTDRYVDLIAEHYDVVIRFGQLKNSNLIAKQLGILKMRTVCASTYPVDLTQMQNNQYLLYRYSTTGQLERWPHFWSDISAANSLIFNSIGSIHTMCVQGSGIAFLPDRLIQQHLNQETLKILPNTQPELKAMYIMWAKESVLSPKKRLFVDYFMQYFNA